MQPLNESGCLNSKPDPRFQDLEFADDFNDANFAVLVGADAAYRFLGPIDE